MAGKVADYDSPWKDILEKFFPQFLEFYFPVAAADTVSYTHLTLPTN